MKRASALALTVVVGVLTIGTTHVPALAHDAEPPPVVPGMLPEPSGRPDQHYRQSVECVKRDLDRNVDLPNTPWGQRYLRLDDVHQLMEGTVGSAGKDGEGNPLRVAVIDTGIAAGHPYFGGRVKPGADYVAEGQGGAGLEDCDGHGTEVAGIIAASTPHDIGFRGVAPDAEIISIRQSSQNYEPDDSGTTQRSSQGEPPREKPQGDGEPGQDGAGEPTGTSQMDGGRTQGKEGSAGTLDTLAQAVVQATRMGVDVMNISINNCRPGNGGITPDEQALQAAVKNAVDQDVVVVTAAGNIGEDCQQNDQSDAFVPRSVVTPPWFADDVLSVAAIDESGGVADFSMRGPWISVAAPGTAIISVDPAEGSTGLANMTVEGGETKPIQGTSFAAPYVTGLAVLVRAKYPDLSAREVMNRITSTAQHPAAPGGRDNFVGYGVIDPMAALTAMVPEEEGVADASTVALPSDMPPGNVGGSMPMIVALTGSGGALAALLVALFVTHTIRRNRTELPQNPLSRSK
ncbi:membrane-anchored mycosin MYCP [Prauserella marina]|uniref:Membrane-anchored mycosin MYCP n=2 Tax=Prauserella marina TaxID=530584 RepID=A0A1G6PAZ1_9PSEU|nr:type VII secretion-associated serine protease mycosin [Prauserella marina]PWV82758.1 membrane-anchored mycosin MYCP [Prauserella marina]SDC76587.1 membrane-anchored mycosin MYCP [Prauserella marina]